MKFIDKFSFVLVLMATLTVACGGGASNPTSPTAGGAQSPTPPTATAPPVTSTTYTVVGVVTDRTSKKPIEGVKLEVTSAPYQGRSAITDGNGYYSIAGLAGTLQFRLTREGYVDLDWEVVVSRSMDYDWTILAAPSVPPVIPPLAGPLPPNTVAITAMSHFEADLVYASDQNIPPWTLIYDPIPHPNTWVDVAWGSFDAKLLNSGPFEGGYFPGYRVTACYTKDRQMLWNTCHQGGINCNISPDRKRCSNEAGTKRLFPNVQESVGKKDGIVDVDGVVVILSAVFFMVRDQAAKYLTDNDLAGIHIVARTERPLKIKYHSR